MSDNRTAAKIYQDHLEKSFNNGVGHKFYIDAMEEYASQQTARLREENERLHQRINLLCMGIDEAVALTEENSEIKQLQEEVERLTGWLIDVDKDFNCLTDSQRKALSSKESKPS